MQRITITGAVISGQEVRIHGYYPASGDYRPIAVNASGEISIHATVADIVTAKISGETVRAEQYGTWEVTANISGQPVSISGQPVDLVAENVAVSSGEIAVLSGEIHILSGEVIAKVSGEVIRAEQYGIWISKISGEIVRAEISGDIVEISGEVVKSEQYGTWGIQVSGAVQVSGEVIAHVSGERIRIEGYYPASGDWRAVIVDSSGLNPRFPYDLKERTGDVNKVTFSYNISGDMETITFYKDTDTVITLTFYYDTSGNLTQIIRT